MQISATKYASIHDKIYKVMFNKIGYVSRIYHFNHDLIKVLSIKVSLFKM